MPLSTIGSFVRSRRNPRSSQVSAGPREHVEEGLDRGARLGGAQVVARRGSWRVMPSRVRIAARRHARLRPRRAACPRWLRATRSATRRRNTGSLVYCAIPCAADERQVRGVEVAGPPAEHVRVERHHDRLAADASARRRSSRRARRCCSSRAGTSAGSRPSPRRDPLHRHRGLAREHVAGCRAPPPRARSPRSASRCDQLEHPDRRGEHRGRIAVAEQFDGEVALGRRRAARGARSASDRTPAVRGGRGLGTARAGDIGPGFRGHRALGPASSRPARPARSACAPSRRRGRSPTGGRGRCSAASMQAIGRATMAQWTCLDGSAVQKVRWWRSP